MHNSKNPLTCFMALCCLGLIVDNPRTVQSQEMALPNLESLGKLVSKHPLVKPSSSKDNSESHYPAKIELDIFEGRIEGGVFLYPAEVKSKSLVRQLDEQEKSSKPYPDMRKFGIYMWRNENARYTIQLTDSDDEEFGAQVVIIWLDRRGGSGAEWAVEITKGFLLEETEDARD